MKITTWLSSAATLTGAIAAHGAESADPAAATTGSELINEAVETVLDSESPAADTILSIHDQFTTMLHNGFDWYLEHSLTLALAAVGLLLSWVLALVVRQVFSLFFIRWWSHGGSAKYRNLTMCAIRKPLAWLVFLGASSLSVMKISFAVSPTFATLLLRCFAAAATLVVVWGIFRLIGVLNAFLLERADESRNSLDALLVTLVRRTAQTILIILTVLFVGQNIFGVNITALLAGAGVIGLAVALAAQDTLSNFFGSLMVILDKPFTVGDMVRSGAISGVVENVGFRSTRVRSLDGNLFQLPNKMLADGVIENVSRRPNIKYVFDLGLVYQTTPEQMKQAMAILGEIIAESPGFDTQANPPLIHFTEFRDWSLNINVIVWFNTNDFVQAQRWKTALNLEILKRFNNAHLDFAYPTATHFISNSNDAPPAQMNNN